MALSPTSSRRCTCGTLTGCSLPASNGQSSDPFDVPWTAAFPLNVNWGFFCFCFLVQYHGDVATAREYWPALKAFADGQIRVANNVTADGLVDFWKHGVRERNFELGSDHSWPRWIRATCCSRRLSLLFANRCCHSDFMHKLQDWKAVENHNLAIESAPQLAAANWLLALRAMASVATAVGEGSDAARHQALYNSSVRTERHPARLVARNPAGNTVTIG